ncbi:hypothetical protein Patl1_15455 [Pistacia atlantica]|uniref:Uncharacterized protein n=1 Tax=Pistacia atlantica TaxID=434234 RepID=A0ACC1BAV1_9ROSI|nr:hypothetical protein Patl1_15455 [Pistacia atlantica]
MTGVIQGMDVQVLIDGGSTHNFIQERVARYLNIPIMPSKHFKVLIGNGDTLECEGYCPQLSLKLNNQEFLVDFYVLNLGGADAVLGVQWLELLGRVIMDYKELYMEFQWHGKTVKLQGEPLLQCQPIQMSQLRKLTQTDGVTSYFHLCALPPPIQETNSLCQILTSWPSQYL